MSNRMFQNVISQYNDVIDRTIGIIDASGTIVACNDITKVNERHPNIIDEITPHTEIYVSKGYTYRPVGNQMRIEHVAFISGEDSEAEKTLKILTISMSHIKNFYNEKYDRSSFIKNVIMDNILPGDIYIKSKELHFNNDVERVVYLIKFTSKSDVIPFDIIQSMFSDKNRDFVISIGEKDIVLVKELTHDEDDEDSNEIETVAKAIVDTVNAEFFTKIMIGIGNTATNIKDLSRSFKEAQVAIEVGKIFDNEKYIASYNNLGIGRLIYQLPTTLCEIFLEEVFKIGSLESLDRESLMTIQSFFENNLNVSETSRKLFVHRNTLVYRLEKIKKLTGLDLREFEHAIIFKVALMVKKYLSSKPIKY